MEIPPLLYSCCGGIHFVLLPYVGYTRLFESLLALALLLILTFTILYLPAIIYWDVRKNRGVLLSVAMVIVSAPLYYFPQISSYCTYALSSLDASVPDNRILWEGYNFYMTDSSQLTQSWRREPHTQVLLNTAEVAEITTVRAPRERRASVVRLERFVSVALGLLAPQLAFERRACPSHTRVPLSHARAPHTCAYLSRMRVPSHIPLSGTRCSSLGLHSHRPPRLRPPVLHLRSVLGLPPVL